MSGSDDFNLYMWKIPDGGGTGELVDFCVAAQIKGSLYRVHVICVIQKGLSSVKFSGTYGNQMENRRAI